MINFRKLVALDMLLHGKRFIISEFALGIILPFILVYWTIRSGLFSNLKLIWGALLCFWLVGCAVNYIPLFIYAVLIARAGTIEEEGRPELPQVKRYSLQQVIVFVPFLVALLALVQGLRHPRS